MLSEHIHIEIKICQSARANDDANLVYIKSSMCELITACHDNVDAGNKKNVEAGNRKNVDDGN